LEIVLSKALSLSISTTRMLIELEDWKGLVTIRDEPRKAVEKAVADAIATTREIIVNAIRDIIFL
jgi:hypothetical protein